MDLQFEIAVLQSAYEDGIIEVARSFAINGNYRKIAKVAPLADLRGRNNRLNCCCLTEHLLRKPVWQVVFADDDFYVNAKVVFVPQNFDDPSSRLLGRRRPVGDLNINDDVFQIAPLTSAGGFFTQNAMFGTRRASSVTGIAPRSFVPPRRRHLVSSAPG